LPFLVDLLMKKTVPLYFWACILGGVVIGARVGSLINILVGKRVMLVAFVILLIGEICRVIVVYAILPTIPTHDLPHAPNISSLTT